MASNWLCTLACDLPKGACPNKVNDVLDRKKAAFPASKVGLKNVLQGRDASGR